MAVYTDVCSLSRGARLEEGAFGLGGAAAAGGGDVGLAGVAEEGDGRGADGGEHLGDRAGADLGAVLVEGHVAHPMHAVLDVPVAAQQAQQRARPSAPGRDWSRRRSPRRAPAPSSCASCGARRRRPGARRASRNRPAARRAPSPVAARCARGPGPSCRPRPGAAPGAAGTPGSSPRRRASAAGCPWPP